MKEENSSERVVNKKYKKLMDQLGRVFESANSKSESSSVEAEKGQFMKLFCEAFDSNTDHTGDEDDGMQFGDESGNSNKNEGWDDREANIVKCPQNSQDGIEDIKSEEIKPKEAEVKDNKEKEEKTDNRDVATEDNIITSDTLLNPDLNAATSHVVRRVLRNLMLMILSRHPNGVYDNELEVEYKRITKDVLPMDDNIEYLLFNHRNVLITPCVNRGNLLTLHHQAVQSILEEYSIPEITEAICGHINAIIRLFPCGISSDILNDVISNFCGYKLSQILSDPHQFVVSNCDVVVSRVERSVVYQPSKSAQFHPNGHNCHGKVLSSAIGYRELFIALLIHHQKPITTEELEREFRQLFGMPLNASSPVINRVLKKINDPKLNQEQKQLQLQHASHVRNEANFSRNVLRSGLRSSCNSLKFMIGQFRLAPNFEAHYEKNRPLFELICAKCREDVSAPIKPLCEEDDRIVFMGGFAYGTSVKELEDALAMYDVKMADCKGISYRNYGWSFVKVENAQQAQKLVACSPIEIRGRTIDVRPFIDRKRVKNHQQNRPSSNELLEAVLEAAHQTSGLTVAQMQTRLFRKFQFRVDGPEITKLVSKNPKLLQIKRHPIERIVLTPKMHRIPIKELKWKILKIFNSHDPTAKSGQEDTLSDNEADNKQKVFSLTEFENEFARRYKAYLEPRLYGYRTVLELLQSMNDILCFPRAHSQSLVSQQQQQQPQPQESGLMFGPLLQANSAVAVTEPEVNWNNPKNFTVINAPIVSTTNPNTMNNNVFLGSMFMCPKINTLPTNQPMNFTGLPHIQMRTQTSLQQISNTETSKPLPTLENSWSLQDTPAQQRQFLLPPFSNLSTFSNSPSGNQSPQTRKQTNTKPSVENTISTNHQNAFSPFKQSSKSS